MRFHSLVVKISLGILLLCQWDKSGVLGVFLFQFTILSYCWEEGWGAGLEGSRNCCVALGSLQSSRCVAVPQCLR